MSDNKIERLSDRQAQKFDDQLESGEISLWSEIRALTPGAWFKGIAPGQWRETKGYKPGDLPPNSPVQPLGYDGDIFYFLTARGTLAAINGASASGTSKGVWQSMFSGQINYLIWAYPSIKMRKKKTGEFNEKSGREVEIEVPHFEQNFKADGVSMDFIDACGNLPPWSAVDRVRGRGAWRDDKGGLILHLGDKVIFPDGEERPGLIGDYLYTKRTPLPEPVRARQPSGPDDAPRQILETLQRWNWGRAKLDPMLMLGWICAAMLGGALDWRPAVFVTGDKAVGKSTIQKLVREVIGPGLIQSANTTAAGIYQHVGNDSLPVAIDELEASAKPQKVMAIIELARQAASGTVMYRGGSDNVGTEFKAQSCFMFSSINMPPLEPADRTRMAVLELRKVAEENRGSPPDLSDMPHCGRELMRRLIDRWGDGDLWNIINLFRSALVRLAGHDGRGADTFGTLYALAWAALHDGVPEDAAIKEMADLLKAEDLAEFVATEENWNSCLSWLLNASPDSLRHKWGTVGEIIREVRETLENRSQNMSVEQANNNLRPLGLTLSWPKGEQQDWEHLRLFVLSNHVQLQKIFEGSTWYGMGVWGGALRQAPPDVTYSKTGRVGLTVASGTYINLAKVFKDRPDVD